MALALAACIDLKPKRILIAIDPGFNKFLDMA